MYNKGLIVAVCVDVLITDLWLGVTESCYERHYRLPC